MITPAVNHLFEVNETARKLSKGGAQVFHRIVAKLLFLCKKAWPDILTSVTFLTTQAREPGEDDGKKIELIQKYLIGTRDFVLNLESESTRTVKWWVDTAFSVHRDMTRLYYPEDFRIFCYFPVQPIGTTLPYDTRTRKSNAKGTSSLPELQLIYIHISYVGLPQNASSY